MGRVGGCVKLDEFLRRSFLGMAVESFVVVFWGGESGGFGLAHPKGGW